MAAHISSAPGISAAPARRQLPPKLQSRFAKKPTSHAGRQYTVAKHAQLSISPTTTNPATMARIAGAQAPHHGPSSVRLNATARLRG